MRTAGLRFAASALVALMISGLLPLVVLAAVPDTTSDSATVVEDGSVNVPVLDNDLTDAGPLSVTEVSPPSNGTATISGGGQSIDYEPVPNYHGPDSFTYVATNDDGASLPTIVTITVTSVNDPPVADNEVATVPEDAGPTAIPVLTGDTDADFDQLTIDSASTSSHGTVVVAGNGLSLTYEPDPNSHGPDSFTYVVTDGIATDQGLVTITVTSVNDPPTVVDENTSVGEDAPPTRFFVLDNDSDVDGDTITITSASNPPHGTTVVAPDHLSLTYQPDSGYSGADTFTYVVSDGVGGTSVGTVVVDVSSVNHPPNALNDLTQMVPEGAGPTSLTVLANDSDPDMDTYAIISATPAAHGVVTILPGGVGLTYDPGPLFYGTDTFKYTLRDSGGLTDPATVVVTVVRDTTGPVVTVPVQRFLGQTVGTKTIKARVAWSATDAGSGVKSYQVQVSVNGHTYTTLKLPSLTRNYLDAVFTNGASYRYRVRATDREGNVSAWRYTGTLRPAVFQETTSLVSYVGTWSTYKTTGALGGAVRLASTLGRTATFHYTMSDFGLIVTRSASSGSADIYVDGVLAGTINLRTTKTIYRQLVFQRHFATLASHTVEVRPTGTGRIDIDAFATLH